MCALTVAVDFDKCLIEPIPPLSTHYILKPNAKHTITRLNNLGVRFVLNTARYGWYYRSAVRFIKDQRLAIDIKRCVHKIPADVYIDDCNIFCREINWYDIEQELLSMLRRDLK